MSNLKKSVRKQVNMTPEIAQLLSDTSRKIGVSESSLLIMAFKQYVDQQKSIDMMGNMEKMLINLQRIKKESHE